MSQAVPPGIYTIHTREEGHEPRAVTCPSEKHKPLYLAQPSNGRNQQWEIKANGCIVSVYDPINAYASTTSPPLIGSAVQHSPVACEWEIKGPLNEATIKTKETWDSYWNPVGAGIPEPNIVLYPNPFNGWVILPVLHK